jgi:hypothetical protein
MSRTEGLLEVTQAFFHLVYHCDPCMFFPQYAMLREAFPARMTSHVLIMFDVALCRTLRLENL